MIKMKRANNSGATTTTPTLPGLTFGFPYGSALAHEGVLQFVEFWGCDQKPGGETKESTQLWRYESNRAEKVRGL
jgi:hypothetical protein